MGVKLGFSSIPPLREEENLEFAALPPLQSAVKSIFQFSSALRGGRLEIADMMWIHMGDVFQSDFLSFFPFFYLLVGHGLGLCSTK